MNILIVNVPIVPWSEIPVVSKSGLHICYYEDVSITRDLFFEDVLFDYLPLAICCHTGEGALAVGCSCRPKRINE